MNDSLLQADTTLAPRLFQAFKEAKGIFLTQLASGGELSGEARALADRRRVVGDDPLPNGVTRNAKALEAVIHYASDQKILPALVKPKEIFTANTLDRE
ncbi:MAG: hypothetical protein ACREKS_08675 [Candidatus Rokuibacteriota bacterium]